VRENPVKRALAAGGTPLGTMVCEFLTSNVPRLVRSAGADFVLYDLEHSGFGLDVLRDLLPATNATGVVPLVRVPDAVYDSISRALDLGALGIMIPACESADEAALLVESARFPPAGKRGFGLLYQDVWEPEGLPATMAKANAETLLLVQIETAAGLAAVDEIAAVDGIDVLWIGQFDLTASLGIPGQLDAARFRDAVTRIVAAARTHGKHVGMVCSSVAECRAMLDEGLSIVGYAFDTWLYEAALRRGISELRGAT
jgi:2-dehydro-3-deoxyglucarate aldolase/4-hydroxy-2-oxoheptanedioate aldolase